MLFSGVEVMSQNVLPRRMSCKKLEAHLMVTHSSDTRCLDTCIAFYLLIHVPPFVDTNIPLWYMCPYIFEHFL